MQLSTHLGGVRAQSMTPCVRHTGLLLFALAAVCTRMALTSALEIILLLAQICMGMWQGSCATL